MAWREALLTRFGTGAFSGVTIGLWLKILRENRFSVDWPYWTRAAAISMSCLPNSFWARWENLLYGRKIREATVHPPLFVLGIWRSGTTHLHNLLARDQRFAYPNNYQVFYPKTFLTTERFNAPLLGFFFPRTRPQDNVAMRIDEPQEDEFAFCSLTGQSFSLGWAFPRRAEYYDRYLSMRDVSAEEVAQWKAALAGFVQKLSYKYDRPLVLKSPGHTCRIKLLLDVFPDARFVHIRRDPYTVFQSTLHTVRKVVPWWTLQRPDYANLEGHTIRQYRDVYDAYFDELRLIPPGRLHEVRFEALEADPIGQLRGTYEALALPEFNVAEPAVRRYVESLSGYRKNAFPEIAPDLRKRIAGEWRRCFDEWGYAT